MNELLSKCSQKQANFLYEPETFRQQKRDCVAAVKSLRQGLDLELQEIKARATEFELVLPAGCMPPHTPDDEKFIDPEGAWRHFAIAIEKTEDAIMRLGMVLKCIGNPSPYPESYNPASPVVEPTADGLKL